MKTLVVVIFYLAVFNGVSQPDKKLKIAPLIAYEYSQYKLNKQYFYRFDVNQAETVKSKESNKDLTYPKFGFILTLGLTDKFELNAGYDISSTSFDFIGEEFNITQHSIPIFVSIKQQIKNDNIFFKPKLGVTILARKVNSITQEFRKGIYCTSSFVNGSGSNGIGVGASGGNGCSSTQLSEIVATMSNTNSHKFLPVLTAGFSIQLIREKIEFGMIGNYHIKKFNPIEFNESETFFSSGENRQLNHKIQLQPYSASIFFIWHLNWPKKTQSSL